MNLRLQLFVLLSFVSITAWGQQSNPFELHHRLDKVKSPQADSVVAQDTDVLAQDTAPIAAPNFQDTDLRDTQAELRDELAVDQIEPEVLFPVDENQEEPIKPETSKQEEEVLELPEMLQSRRNLIFSTFIILTLFLTVVISFNRAIVNKVIRSILNDNFLNLLYREQKGKWSMQFLFLYVFFIANLALFLFLMDDKWSMEKIDANLLYLCGIIALIYFSRHFSLNMLGNTFPISKETGQFSFTIMLFNIFLGLILLPVNLFIAFAPISIAHTFIYIGLGTLGLFYFLRQLRGLFIGARFIMHNKFHFLLYLCTVEIAPMAVLYKFFQPFFN